MTRRAIAFAIAVVGCMLLAPDARANGVEVRGISCPETARRNTFLNPAVVVSFENWNATQDATVTRGALALHLGNVTLIGPLAFSVPANTTVPRGTVNPPPPGCFDCPSSVTPGTASLTVPNVRIPFQARPGTFITVGLGFFGTIGADTTRKELGGEACVIEIIP